MQDWVKARAECSLAKVFQQIRLGVEGDVKSRNAQRPSIPSYVFETAIDDDAVVVIVKSTSDSGSLRFPQSVIFRLTDTSISVRDKNDKPMFEATLTLNDEGECRLKVGELELEFWQFRRRALEDLFFRV
jgi:hypothetical protein